MHLHASRHCPAEWAFESGQGYADPFNDVTLDVVFTSPDGDTFALPAFWAGEQSWRVRFAGHACSVYRWRTVCSDVANPDLHGAEGTVVVSPYEGANPLWKHGPLRVAEAGRTFEHLDGTPFFWLADT